MGSITQVAPGAQDVLLPYCSSAVTGRIGTFPKEACMAFRNQVQASGSQIMLLCCSPVPRGSGTRPGHVIRGAVFLVWVLWRTEWAELELI